VRIFAMRFVHAQGTTASQPSRPLLL
jgi:hypothetical protein